MTEDDHHSTNDDGQPATPPTAPAESPVGDQPQGQVDAWGMTVPTAPAGGTPVDQAVVVPPGIAPPGPGQPDPSTTPRRGVSRRRIVVWSVVGVVVVAIIVASGWNLDYYALQPGSAQSVQQFITVPPAKNHPVKHPVLLTDVQEGRVTALTYYFYKLQGNTTMYKVDEVTGRSPPSQLGAQGELEMSQAEAAAKTAALRRLGYTVTATPAGAVIFATYPGTPAYEALQVGDVVTAVNGTPTLSAESLDATLKKYHSGQTITMTVKKGGKAPAVPVPVTLKSTKVDVGVGTPVTLDLGISPEDQIDYTYPFPVAINVTNIGGPSAGLAMTLGVIDALTSGSVTGGRTVAATGTIDSLGNVGDVGGVAQKTIAVENAGATIFLVPPQEYKAAMGKDRAGLKIYAVSTLNQALAILAAHGGVVPPASGAAPAVSAAAG